MFESILIRPSKSRSHALDFGQVIENLFFYQKTIVNIGPNEIPALYDLADVDVLEKLLSSQYLSIYYNNSHSGIVMANGLRSVSTFGLSNIDIEAELYKKAFSHTKDDFKSKKFAKKIARLIKVHELPSGFIKLLEEQIRDESFLRNVTNEVLKHDIPNFNAFDKVRYELEFLDSVNFRIHTNIQVNDLYRFTHESPVMALIGGIEDMYVMSQYSSEISVPEFNASIIRLKTKDILDRSKSSQKNIEAFNHYVYNESWALREAINTKRIHVKAILKILDKATSYKDWLSNIENDSNLLREYIAKVEEKSILEKIPSRGVRFFVFNGLSTIISAIASPEISIPTTIALNSFDAFCLEKLKTNWKPNQFIENELKPLVSSSQQ